MERDEAEQLERFKAAVDRKAEASEVASHVQSPGGTAPEAIQGTQRPLEAMTVYRELEDGTVESSTVRWDQTLVAG